MKILSIETSCDETAISLVEAKGKIDSPSFSVLGNALFSQIDLHQQYGGVFPTLAKREHAKNLPPILEKVLTEAKSFKTAKNIYSEELWNEIEEILKKEEGLYPNFRALLEPVEKPEIDVIAVTLGPGLEPALWVGISFAIALGKLWNIPVIPVNHMEGHIFSVLTNDNKKKIGFPALALLISGGHTELVKIEKLGSYKLIGKTVDDAVGEAFDKSARLLGLPYPGGPEIGKLAEIAREKNLPHNAKLPRPMLHSHDLNFSFSGLKTAVLYYLRDHFDYLTENPKELSQDEKADLAREIEDAITEVLEIKTKKALENSDFKTLIVAGGVIGSPRLRNVFQNFETIYPDLSVKIPEKGLNTDNSIMIACAGYIRVLLDSEILTYPQQIRAKGNLELE